MQKSIWGVVVALAVTGVVWSVVAYDQMEHLLVNRCPWCLYSLLLVPALAVVLVVVAVRRDASGMLSYAAPLAAIGLVLLGVRATGDEGDCSALGTCTEFPSSLYVVAAVLEVAVLAVAAALVITGRRSTH